MSTDGLNSLKYTVQHVTEYPLYTLVSVDVKDAMKITTTTWTPFPTSTVDIMRGEHFKSSALDLIVQSLAWVVRKVDNTIHSINYYAANSVVCFGKTYPLDSDLSGG